MSDPLIEDKTDFLLQYKIMDEYIIGLGGFPIEYGTTIRYLPTGNVYGWNGDTWQKMHWTYGNQWVFV